MSCRLESFRAICLGSALTLVGAVTPAGAAMLASPSIDVAGSDVLVCRIVNLGAKPIEVHIAVVDSNTGKVSADDDPQIAPGQADLVSSGRITGHCVFSGAFRKSDVRASLDVFSQDRSILVVPAN